MTIDEALQDRIQHLLRATGCPETVKRVLRPVLVVGETCWQRIADQIDTLARTIQQD